MTTPTKESVEELDALAKKATETTPMRVPSDVDSTVWETRNFCNANAVASVKNALYEAWPAHRDFMLRALSERHVLTFDEFRRANVARGEKWNPAGIASWSPSDWLTAVTGELGELAALLKMRNRERDGLPGNKFSPTSKQIADELADVLTYLDLLAEVLGVDLGRAAVEKFNEVSERVGFPDRIALSGQSAAPASAQTDRAMEQLIDERDKAEEVIADIYFRIMGRSAEWSNLFGHRQAIEDIVDAFDSVRAAAKLNMAAPAQPTSAVPEQLENIRRAAERGLSAAQKRNDSEAIDTFQLVLDNYRAMLAASPAPEPRG